MKLAAKQNLAPRNNPQNARFLYEMQKGATSAPDMPKTCLIGMTSQMALHLFDRLPNNALFIIDEVQKYIGNQDLPASQEDINHVVERKNFFCMLSEAVKQNEKHNTNLYAGAMRGEKTP